MLLFTVYSNSAYAQLAKTVGIKITSPIKGQQISVGIKNLQISGTSSHNSTMKCQVSLIVNDVRPYQQTAGGHRGDYSSWNYSLTPQYTSLKQGINKITAKLSCHDNSMNVTKFYSTNITGITSSSKQASLNVSKSDTMSQTKNQTGKTTTLPAKQNKTSASMVLQPIPNTLTVNGILAKTGVLAAVQQKSVSQSNTSSTTGLSEKHYRHHPSAASGRTENSASVSVEAHSLKHHQENATPTSNSTASNGTASNNTIAIPSATNSTVSKVSIPSATGAVSTVNSTVTGQQQHNVTVPFSFASPSSFVGSAGSLSPTSNFNNNHQSLQIPPIANAGPAQVVTPGSQVILNGSNSKAPTGIILSYSWMQIPTGASITLSGVNTPVWEFTAPKVDANTLLRFQLTVTNNFGQTAADTVNILDKAGSSSNAPTPAQVVRSTPAITTSIPSITQNKISNSVSIPNNNEVVQPPLTAPISPPLTPPINTQLAPQVNNAAQPPSNDSPIANAGQDQVVNSNSTVVLVGSLSKDPDGDPISYHWTQVNGSPAITLAGVNTPVWEFTAPNLASDTTLTFQLTVTDSHGLSNSGKVNVLVKAHSAPVNVITGHNVN